MALLSADLINRLRTRAADPDTRTDAPPSTRGKATSFGGFSIVGLRLDGPHLEPQPPVEPEPLNPPAASKTIAAVERRLGFALPPDLRQVYGEIADGGFGPGSGLAPLHRIADRYLDLLAHPPGERGQTWPADLLPFTLTEPGADCYDRPTGEIILWDEESLADGPSDKVWNSSFKMDAPSLSEWLERWLATPTPDESAAQGMEKVMLDGMRRTLAEWRAKTPQERAEFGLPEIGWEKELFGHLDIDLDDL